MIQGLVPLVFTVSGVLATGVAVYVAVERQDLFEPSPPEIIELKQPEAPATPEPKVEVVEEEPQLPGFDILRVEKDGSVVIAGHGPGESKVEILNGDPVIAWTESGKSGDFALVLDDPLAPGTHQLIIRATSKEGDVLLSAEAGIIHIPEEGTEEVTVLVAEPDEPSRILQEPDPVSEPEVESEPEVVSEPDAETVEIAEPEPVAETVPVLIEAAEVEKDKIFIAGTGEAGAQVNLYLNDELLGTADVQTTGAFLFEGVRSLEKGRYAVRADMIEYGTSNVLARAEVSLLHEPVVAEPEIVVAAVEPEEPAPETEVVIPAVAPAEPEPENETAVAEPEEPEPESEAVAAATEPTPEIRTGASVIIRRGDSLWKVARRNYGAGIRYTTIFEANRDQVRDADLIYPGQVLKVPAQAEANDGDSSG